jgi:purine-nucleoside phosphorylase
MRKASDVDRYLNETVDALHGAFPVAPHVGVVLGTGLGSFAERLRKTVTIPYGNLPHLPKARALGHEGNLWFGYVDDVPIVCLQGRAHLYEGHPTWAVVHGVRVLARLGVRSVLVTQAAGALDPSWTPGTLMVVTDHLNFMFHESIVDYATSTHGREFEQITHYDAPLSAELHDVARAENHLSARIGKPTNIVLREGVYAGVRDPSYGTPAHARMLRALGAHAVGMSTIPEVVALREMGVRVAALSYITYIAAPDSNVSVEDDTTSRYGLAHFERVVRGWTLRADRT